MSKAKAWQAEPEALEILARRAAGSMRDSQSLLEQLLAFGATQITVADVHRLLGTAGADRLGRLVEYLVERNAAAALAEVDRAASEGVDIGQLLDQLLGYFRDVMAAAVGCPADSLLHVSPAEQAGVQEAAGKLGLETILAVLQILDQTLSRIKYLSHPRIVAELALVRICQLEDLDSLPQLIADLRQTGGEQSQAGSVAGLASKKKYDAPLTDSVAGTAQTVVAHNGKDPVAIPHSNGTLTGNGHAKVEAGEFQNGHQHDARWRNRQSDSDRRSPNGRFATARLARCYQHLAAGGGKTRRISGGKSKSGQFCCNSRAQSTGRHLSQEV